MILGCGGGDGGNQVMVEILGCGGGDGGGEGVNTALQLCLQTVDMRDAGQKVDGQTSTNASACISCTMQHC